MSTTIRSSAGLIGVLGGMGPLATVDFMQKLARATPARIDQDHVPALVSSIPQIPDRTEAFRGKGPSPLEALVECAVRLEAAGVGMIVMPCNTAHLWFDDIRQRVGTPMLHIVDAAIQDALQRCGSHARIGLLATEATTASGLYVDRRPPGREAPKWVLPTDEEMAELVMPGIAEVKAGRLQSGRLLLENAASALRRRGAEALVLGCTEIPIVIDDDIAQLPTVDATDSLARRAVRWSLEQRMQTA
jgi:aspartate racemase